MEYVNNESKSIEEIRENYENIRLALSGLMEILKINYDKEDLYYQLSIDNLKGIKNNLKKILEKSYSSRQIKLKLREIELDDDLELKEKSFI
jgi:hypothetical protein